MTYCSRICTPESFRPSDCSRVRWLDWENDYSLARAYWPQDPPLPREDWEQNRADGFRYCAIVEQETIAALAAVWTYSETHWEVAAVSRNLATTCLTDTFPVHWTKTLPGQHKPGKMLRGNCSRFVSQ